MAVGAMECLLLWLPLDEIWPSVLWKVFYYGYRCLKYGSRYYGMASAMVVGAMKWLLLFLPLHEIWLSVL